jgi:hypothetical protein
MKNYLLGFFLVLSILSANEKPFSVRVDRPEWMGNIIAQNDKFTVFVGCTEATPAVLTLDWVVERELFSILGNSVWTAVTPIQTLEVLGASEREGVLFEYTPKSLIRLVPGTYRIRFQVRGSDVPQPVFTFYIVTVPGPVQ